MTPTRFALVACILAAAGAAHAAGPVTPLLELGQTLRTARAAAPDAEPRASCPAQAQHVAGVTRKQVLDALGRPDLHEPVGMLIETAASWSYSFMSRAARGAGYRNVTFYFGPGDRVKDVDCYFGK